MNGLIEIILLIIACILSGICIYLMGHHSLWITALLVVLFGLVFWIGLNVIVIVFAWIASRFVDKEKEVTAPSHFYQFLLRILISITFFFSNISLKIEGREKLPKDKKFLMVGNHLSDFDPMSLMLATGNIPLVFISKPENFNYHMVGKLIHKAGFMAIDRDNVRNALVTINKAADYIRDGVTNVFIFPEGTRNRTKEPLIEFKNGAFKIATKAKCPIVIAAMVNTEMVKKNAPWKHTVVTVKIVDVIEAERVATMRTSEISEEVYRKIFDNIEHNK